mmetsp:Transcript_119558/g.333590  ORF Transcript_119558/g.333590 Transcript_119558/m.333590 type:complete len:278 (-) Transcript_119558:1399-2232(-)
MHACASRTGSLGPLALHAPLQGAFSVLGAVATAVWGGGLLLKVKSRQHIAVVMVHRADDTLQLLVAPLAFANWQLDVESAQEIRTRAGFDAAGGREHEERRLALLADARKIVLVLLLRPHRTQPRQHCRGVARGLLLAVMQLPHEFLRRPSVLCERGGRRAELVQPLSERAQGEFHLRCPSCTVAAVGGGASILPGVRKGEGWGVGASGVAGGGHVVLQGPDILLQIMPGRVGLFLSLIPLQVVTSQPVQELPGLCKRDILRHLEMGRPSEHQSTRL